jgi:hypothetical protein
MTRLHTTIAGRNRSMPAIRVALLAGAMAGALAGCSGNIPYFTAPTSVPNTPDGIQNAVGGLFAGTRINLTTYQGFLFAIAAGAARDGAYFTNTEPRTVEYPLGVLFITATFSGMWAQEYQNISQARQIQVTIPKVTPLYSAAQAAAVNGVVETIEALNYMFVLEAHDTLGVAIMNTPIASSPPPAYCMRDGWAYVVSLLDSANANFTAAGSIPIPIKLPPGFAGVSAVAGPSSASGSFASFNRALAAKANLELAYAIARSPGGVAPTPTTPGAPDAGALTTAAADIAASGMYDPSALGPTTPGGWIAGPDAVLADFSSASGDVVNPVNQVITDLAQLNDFVADVDTVSDLRWKAKFALIPTQDLPLQDAAYNVVASNYQYSMYPDPGSPIPIVREEQLVLWNAQILLAQGNLAAALALVNDVRTAVGGLPAFPGSVASSYTSMRDSLMKEQRISTTFEASADRAISIRMYGLAAVADTTWEHEDPSVTSGDLHTTVWPIPQSEIDGRGGNFTTICP